MPAPFSLRDELRDRIERDGPMPLSAFMAAANAHYYATRDPLGAAGDFVTAPEVSQMFGELVGLCLADAWHRAGRPQPVHYVELGPGRGTLAADALRAMAKAGLHPAVHLVETSPALREAQAVRLPGATWHDDLSTLPTSGALLVIANEFFDALPIRQLRLTEEGWRERMVGRENDRFVLVDGAGDMAALVPEALAGSRPGSILELRPAAADVAAALGARLAGQGGAALLIDYGYSGPLAGDSFQAIERHERVDPLDRPGERDLTAHVDFAALRSAAQAAGAATSEPVTQAAFLLALGIDQRAEALRRAAPHRAADIEAARTRLIAPAAMGTLFRVLALRDPRWPELAGI